MKVLRDAYGIPHLRAGSVDELAYLQGRVTAEDRGPQIEEKLTVPALIRYAFADPTHLRLVAEPDIRNEKAIHRLQRHGFEPGPVIDLGHKRARLTFLTRSRFSSPGGGSDR